MLKKPVALQTFTVRDELAKDYKGTIEQIAKIGYKGIEIGGDLGGMPPAEMRKFIDGLGLKAISYHCMYDQLTDNTQSAIDFAKEFDMKFVVCPVASAETADGWRSLGQSLEKAGAKLHEAGIRLCYHNHAHELKEYDGVRAIDILLGSTSDKLLFWQLDTFWVKTGGVDPTEYIRNYAGRIPLIHLKDMTAGDNPTFAEVGAGILDWKEIFSAADEAVVEWYVVEQDSCQRPPLESIRISLDNLKKIGVAE